MPNIDASGSNEVRPTPIDITKASVARVYDAVLNGKDNYEIDRKVVQQLKQAAPGMSLMAWDNRSFLIRATRFIASQTGITQFLDCGSGLPTAENTHQVAQRLQPDSRVVYVDNDPVVLAHGRALLEENDQTHFSAADIFNPAEILNDEIVRKYLDFSEPMALFQIGTLPFCDTERNPQRIMAEYIDALPSGSYVAITHFIDPETSELSEFARRLEKAFLHSPMGRGTFRTRTEIEGMLTGLEVLDPGFALCAEWWPDGPRVKPLDTVQKCIVGAVGRKP